MLKPSVLASALAAASAGLLSSTASAASDRDIAKMREEIRQMKQDYENRIRSLEERLQAVQAQQTTQQPTQLAQPVQSGPASEITLASTSAPADVLAAAPLDPGVLAPLPTSASGTASSANAFNPAISAILNGTYSNLSQNPEQFRIQGFVPGGEEAGPGSRSFSLGESELTLSASVDPTFAGKLTFALAPDDGVEVEEAFFQTQGLSNGLNIKGGRMLSSVGYLNSIHAHAWDFVDAPLVYQAFFGGQYKTDGVQVKWLVPTDRYFEVGAEAGNGNSFPGNDRNKNGIGSVALFAHVGDDIGESASWRAGVSYLHTSLSDRTYDDTDSTGAEVSNAVSGDANTWIIDGVYKWAPNGNAAQRNFKLQGEYFYRRESGTLAFDTTGAALSDSYRSAQSGWYLQGIYQFMPKWRAGLRFDKLYAGTPDIGLVDSGDLSAADFPALASYNPERTSLMLDYSPSEFSRLRLQLAQDKSRPGVTDNELFIQYIMSLGAHGAHSF